MPANGRLDLIRRLKFNLFMSYKLHVRSWTTAMRIYRTSCVAHFLNCVLLIHSALCLLLCLLVCLCVCLFLSPVEHSSSVLLRCRRWGSILWYSWQGCSLSDRKQHILQDRY